MYNNIGEKIKSLAVFFAVICALAFFISGITVCLNGAIGFGIGIIVGGALLSWISSFFVYGFGQLIENSDIIASNVKAKKAKLQIEKDNRKIDNNSQESCGDESSLNEYVDFCCPRCGKTISYKKDLIRTKKVLICPMCNRSFSTDDVFQKS